MVGQTMVRKPHSQSSFQEILGESRAETGLTAVTPQAVTPRTTTIFPEIKVVPRKRKLPTSFSTATGDRKRPCVNLSIYVKDLHNPAGDPIHDDNDILDQEQEGTDSAISKNVILGDGNDVLLKTGPSWQDLRRLPCGRVCFDPAFYGC